MPAGRRNGWLFSAKQAVDFLLADLFIGVQLMEIALVLQQRFLETAELERLDQIIGSPEPQGVLDLLDFRGRRD